MTNKEDREYYYVPPEVREFMRKFTTEVMPTLDLAGLLKAAYSDEEKTDDRQD